MEVVIVLGGPNTKENIKALLENRYGKAYEDFRFVGVDGGALRLLDQHLPMEVAIGDFDSVTKRHRFMYSVLLAGEWTTRLVPYGR